MPISKLETFFASFCCQTGKLSTGDSLDMSPHDEASIIANDATLKDMEVIACEILEFAAQNEVPGAL